MTTPKSDLDYLLSALTEHPDGTVRQTMTLICRRAIELRNAAKELGTPRGEAGDRAGPLVSPQPNSLGDDLPKRLRGWSTTPFGIHGTMELCDEAANTIAALLAERDAARAELKEAVVVIDGSLCEYNPCEVCEPRRAFLDRVGKV